MLSKWIESAIAAEFSKKENRHYIVEKEDIKIVDNDNTGVI
jgi:preprotein translocase subunit SecA